MLGNRNSILRRKLIFCFLSQKRKKKFHDANVNQFGHRIISM